VSGGTCVHEYEHEHEHEYYSSKLVPAFCVTTDNNLWGGEARKTRCVFFAKRRSIPTR